MPIPTFRPRKKGEKLPPLKERLARIGLVNDWDYVLHLPLRYEDETAITLIADLVLQIFAYVAQTEREFIRQRQAEGIAAAKAKGKRLGRIPLQMPEEFEPLFEAWCAGKISIRNAAKRLGVSHSTFYRRCRQRQAEEQKKFVSDNRLSETTMLK